MSEQTRLEPIEDCLRSLYRRRELPTWGELLEAADEIDRLRAINATLVEALQEGAAIAKAGVGP